MKKLIDECGTPKACWNCQPEPCDQCDTIDNIFQRLKEYEDTGLMPNEIPHWISVNERMPEEYEIEGNAYSLETHKAIGIKKEKCSELVSTAMIDKKTGKRFISENITINGKWQYFSEDCYITHWAITLKFPEDKTEDCNEEKLKSNLEKENKILKNSFEFACHSIAKMYQNITGVSAENRFPESVIQVKSKEIQKCILTQMKKQEESHE